MSETKAPSILVVDDEEVNLQILTQILTSQKYRVAKARDGRDALDYLEKNAADMVLLDIVMPGPSGLEVLKTIRRTRSLGQLPVIMLTGKDTEGDVSEAFSLGANDYITKPIDIAALIARVRTHLCKQ